jgi:hypothetical protein
VASLHLTPCLDSRLCRCLDVPVHFGRAFSSLHSAPFQKLSLAASHSLAADPVNETMGFAPPSWVPDITPRIPAGVNVGDFVLDGRRAEGSARPLLVDASTGRTCTTEEMSDKVDALAAALHQDLGWSPDESSAGAKVVGVVCLNSVGVLPCPHNLTCRLLCPGMASKTFRELSKI